MHGHLHQHHAIYNSYDKYAMFTAGIILAIVMLCCICAVLIGLSFIFYNTSRYWRTYVSKRNGMYNNVNIESEIDQV